MKKLERYYRPLPWLSALLLTALLAGCGGGGKDPILGAGGAVQAQQPTPAPVVVPPTPDTTRPSVSSTVPATSTPGPTNIAPNSAIVAVFSEAMAPASVTAAGTFALSCAAPCVTPTGAVTYDAGSDTATFTPSAALANATTYTATITTAATDVAGNALAGNQGALPAASNYVWTFTTSSAPDTTRPRVSSTVPVTTTPGPTPNIAPNTAISAVFSEAMVPASVTTSGTFTLSCAAPCVAPTGTVTYDVASSTAIFKPSAVLATTTTYTATITTAATDLAGNALAGNQAPLPAASNYVWTFTTAAAPDTTPPTIVLENPANNAINVALNNPVNATFSEPMDPTTIKTANFTVQVAGPPIGSPLTGTVTYDPLTYIATFTPASALVANTTYTATITGAKDLAGNVLAPGAVPNPWVFTTGTGLAPGAVSLGSASTYGDLGGTAGTTNQGIYTVVNGDLGTTATTTSSVTGFHDSADIYTQTGSNIGTVNGTIYTCTISTTGPTSVTPNPASCSLATQALSDAQTAYNNLTPATLPGGTDPGAGQLGGLTLAPGIYKSASGTFQITGSDLTLDGQGNANAVWVFQMASSLTVGGPALPMSVQLINGAQAKNVFWQVGSSAIINAAGGGTMVGNILAHDSVAFSTVGNVALVTLNGRAVGLNASLTMTNTVINVPAP
ncbi:MAG TPA: Ig-like domain-containing protein [Halothiobacillus sp.]|nr:Ig-like domain-containing protein [Halothiobacillus sp.]